MCTFPQSFFSLGVSSLVSCAFENCIARDTAKNRMIRLFVHQNMKQNSIALTPSGFFSFLSPVGFIFAEARAGRRDSLTNSANKRAAIKDVRHGATFGIIYSFHKSFFKTSRMIIIYIL